MIKFKLRYKDIIDGSSTLFPDGELTQEFNEGVQPCVALYKMKSKLPRKFKVMSFWDLTHNTRII